MTREQRILKLERMLNELESKMLDIQEQRLAMKQEQHMAYRPHQKPVMLRLVSQK